MKAGSERTEVPPRSGEREMLGAFLDFHRDTMEWKCSGLTSAQLKDPASPPSPLTLLGLLRHLAEAEHYWFDTLLVGGSKPAVYEGASPWDELDAYTVDEVIRRWKQTCETSRRNVASVPSCDQAAALGRFWDGELVNLRWILIHMIEEYARHNGHADLLRERIDGARGD